MTVPKNQKKTPSLRNRLMNRAEDLVGDAEYLGALAALRTVWNAHFPDWPVFGTGAPSDPVTRMGDLVVPAALYRAYEDAIEYTDSVADLPFEERMARIAERPTLTSPGSPEVGAVFSWVDVTNKLANRFWPETDFPIYDYSQYHPARSFVAGCLIYSPADIPTHWMTEFDLQLRWSRRSPDVLSTTLAQTLSDLELLVEHAKWQQRPSEPPTGVAIEKLEELLAEARKSLAMPTERFGALFVHQNDPLPGDYLYLPIPRSTIKEDYVAAFPAIADVLRRDAPTFLGDRIRALALAGLTPKQIEQTLGINDEVRRYHQNKRAKTKKPEKA